VTQLHYVDQSAQELRLSVVQGPIDTSQLQIISESSIPLGDFSVDAFIIGASHCIQFKIKGVVVLTEVLACVKLDVDNTLVNSVRNVSKFRYNLHDVTYEFGSHRGTSEAYNTKYASLLEKAAVLSTHKQDTGLIHVFPSVNADPFIPATVVCVDACRKGHIYIDTVHAYPNEDMLVFTKTVITY